MASCPDSDNSWVLAGTESLPVETLGPECRPDPESESASEAGGEGLAGTLAGEENFFQSESPPVSPPGPEEPEAKAASEPPGPGDAVVREAVQEPPQAASLGLDTADPEDQSAVQNLPASPQTGWVREEGRCSTSEDDTDVDAEGLRRRRGRQLRPPQTAAPLDVEGQARGEGVGSELGFSLNMCLLGALVLLGLGVLLFSGGLSESETGPPEEAELQVVRDAGTDPELDAVGDGQDQLSAQLQASASTDSVPRLQNMGLLLDRLAKESQGVRLLQARLQAQKEELQSLMRQPKGLEEENARLRGALQRGEASRRALESELQQLRARLQALEPDCAQGPEGLCLGAQGGRATVGRGPQGQDLEAEAQALRRELQRERQLLRSVQRDLQRSLRDAGLAELGHRLARTLKGLQNWGQDPAAPANASEAWHQEPQRAGKEKWRDGQRNRKAEHGKHRKEDSARERRESFEPAGRWMGGKARGEERGPQRDPKGPAWKSGSHHSGERQKHPRGREGATDSPGSPPHWAALLRRRYKAPQGCSGVAGCARQEGLAFFGVELAPVREQELASLLRTYLEQRPWAQQLAEDLPLSPAYFSEDGVFRHDRLRFRDFVDALEDSLEEAAVWRTGDDDDVDDFEDFVFSHFLGDRALKRSGKKDKHFRSPRVVGPREEHSLHPQHYHRG